MCECLHGSVCTYVVISVSSVTRCLCSSLLLACVCVCVCVCTHLHVFKVYDCVFTKRSHQSLTCFFIANI
ncbi:hypothetical protein EXN66_Car012568 [Channa argus]|uniref:Uncharacterized protein n=1 Tax=Channa argus TaxID=215402 RepID=A0A6G1Q361_CHAAH|nr:hypothetical protein EXN66_Car012568 [Channa argus]